MATAIAVTVPAKRRRTSEHQLTSGDVKMAKLRMAAAVAAFLGRGIRVFLSPRVWGNRGGGAAARTAEASSTTVIRVIFPDGYVMEAKFGRAETAQQLVNLVRRAVRWPDLPFYVYTAPPKQRMVDMSVDLQGAGLVPGANVYFSWDVPAAEGEQWLVPCLRDEVRSLQWLDLDLGDI